MQNEWDSQWLSENFTDFEMGEYIDTTPLRNAREEEKAHLRAVIIGQINGVMRQVVEDALDALIKLEKK